MLEIYADRKINPRKATRGMATSKIAKASATGKLSVVFDADCRQLICNNAERFNNEIGFIIRNHGTFGYKDWRLVPEEVRAPLRCYLQVLLVLTFLYLYVWLFYEFILYCLCHLG